MRFSFFRTFSEASGSKTDSPLSCTGTDVEDCEGFFWAQNPQRFSFFSTKPALNSCMSMSQQLVYHKFSPWIVERTWSNFGTRKKTSIKLTAVESPVEISLRRRDLQDLRLQVLPLHGTSVWVGMTPRKVRQVQNWIMAKLWSWMEMLKASSMVPDWSACNFDLWQFRNLFRKAFFASTLTPRG